MIDRTFEYASKGSCAEHPLLPDNLPQNIASVPKPEKRELLSKQISRFRK